MCRIARLCPGCENAVAEQPFAGCAHVLPPRLHPVSKAPSCPRYSPSPHRRWISLFPRFRFAVSSFHWRSARQRAPSGKRHRYITVSRRISHLNDIASTVIPTVAREKEKGWLHYDGRRSHGFAEECRTGLYMEKATASAMSFRPHVAG